jgi:hypothetical protein
MEGRTVAVGWEEANDIAFGLTVVAYLFGKADGSQRTAGTKPFVVGDRRAFDGVAELAGQRDGPMQFRAGGVVDGNANRDVGGVIVNPAFGDGLSEGFFEKHGVGDELHAIGGPGSKLSAFGPRWLSAFVFVGQVGTIAATQAIDFAGESESGTGEFDVDGFALLISFECGMELPPRENGGVGNADFFDFFEVEETLTVSQRVQSHNSHGRLMGIKNRQGHHGVVSLG